MSTTTVRTLNEVLKGTRIPETHVPVQVAWTKLPEERGTVLHVEAECSAAAVNSCVADRLVAETDIRTLTEPLGQTGATALRRNGAGVCRVCPADHQVRVLLGALLGGQMRRMRQKRIRSGNGLNLVEVMRNMTLLTELESAQNTAAEQWVEWVGGYTLDQLRETGKTLSDWEGPLVAVFGGRRDWTNVGGELMWGYNGQYALGVHIVGRYGTNEPQLYGIVPANLIKDDVEGLGLGVAAVDERFNVNHLKLAANLYHEFLLDYAGRKAHYAADEAGRHDPAVGARNWRQTQAEKAVETAVLCL